MDCISQDSEFSRHGAKDEHDVYEMIDHSFYDLIKEDTFPWVLKKWLDFDVKYMMPVFKRKTNLSGSGTGMMSSMRSDKKINFTRA